MGWRSRRTTTHVLSNGARADRYGKTVGPYRGAMKRVKKGNKAKFKKGEQVTVFGREGLIDNSYEHDGIIYYRIEWNKARKTWYDQHIGQEPSKFGWSEARHIRRVNDVN